MNNEGTGNRNAILTMERDFQIAELNYQRTYRWNIFTWASSLLFGGGSGLVAVNAFIHNESNDPQHILKYALIFIILTLTAISCFWLHYHFTEARQAEDNIWKLTEELKRGINSEFEKKLELTESQKKSKKRITRVHIGSLIVLIFLGLAGAVIVCFSQL